MKTKKEPVYKRGTATPIRFALLDGRLRCIRAHKPEQAGRLMFVAALRAAQEAGVLKEALCEMSLDDEEQATILEHVEAFWSA